MNSQPTKEEQTEDEFVIERLGGLLAEIAITLKGPQPAGTLWSYHDLPKLVRVVIADRDFQSEEAVRWKNAHQVAMVERDNFKQIAEINLRTVKDMQIGKEIDVSTTLEGLS